MKKLKLISIIVGAVLLTAAGGAAGAYWLLRPAEEPVASAPEPDTREYRYVTLDKVIVMLRGREGGPLTNYLAVDLVFKTPVPDETTIKQQLPKLRSIALRSLSEFTLDQAGMLTIPALSEHIQKAYVASFEAEARPMPFGEVMIGKLIIE
jgi:flagellar FliL protein